MNNELLNYIKEARKLGRNDATIKSDLANVGWSEKDIASAFPKDNLRIPQPTVSIAKEVFMYVISFLFPPFGLIWAFKYFRGKTERGRRIGIIIIVVTAISLIINIWIIIGLYNKYFELIATLGEI